jgi:hypothetical protein
MIELVSVMPAPKFGDESSLSARIRAGSRFSRFLCFVLIDVRCFRVIAKMFSGISITQVEYQWFKAYPRLKTSGLKHTPG